MDDDFLFYSLFRDEMSEDMEAGFNARLNLIYRYTREVSGNGVTFERAVSRTEPRELITVGAQMYRFNCN